MTGALILRSLAVAIGAMVVNVVAAFAWVAFYSLAIAPGQSEAAYEAYAQRAVPWSSVIAGVPILFGAGWLLARWLGRAGWRAGIGAGIGYIAIDLAILIASGSLLAMPGIIALSYVTKLAAAAIGGSFANR